MSDNEIDSLFKTSLADQVNEPPVHIWTNIERHLSRKRKKKIILWWLEGIAALFIIFFSVEQLQKVDSDRAVMFQLAEDLNDFIEIEDDSCLSEQVELATISSFDDTFSDSGSSTPKTEIPKKEKDTVLLVALATQPVLSVDRFAGPEKLRLTVKRNDNFIPLVSKTSLENNLAYRTLLQQDNTQAEVQKDRKSLKFALSGHIAPAYASGSYHSSAVSPRGAGYSSRQMDGITKVSGGLRLAVSTGNRWSFQSGIFYNTIGQLTQNNSNVNVTPLLTMSIRNTNECISTPLGNIKRKSHVRPKAGLSAHNLSKGNTDLEQVFGTLSIPLSVRFRINDNRIKFSVSGGFGGNFVVSNKVYQTIGNEREYIGSTENIRHVNLSTDWGLGMEYAILPKVKLILEPEFKYYLQSLSEDSVIDFKPYVFSLSAGIGIEF